MRGDTLGAGTENRKRVRRRIPCGFRYAWREVQLPLIRDHAARSAQQVSHVFMLKLEVQHIIDYTVLLSSFGTYWSKILI